MSASEVRVPYEVVVPYSTCEDVDSSVVHAIVAPVDDPDPETEEIVGLVVSIVIVLVVLAVVLPLLSVIVTAYV